jgi:tetratricopeptide (TPR) repeat protein
LQNDQYKKSLNHYKESLLKIQKLIRTNPDNFEWKQNLSEIFINLGNLFILMNNYAKANYSFNKALEICLDLIEFDKENYSWKENLSLCSSQIKKFENKH